MPFECDVNVLGKFFALQSLLHAAPDEKWMGNVLCRGTVEIPGLCSVALYLEGEQVAHSSSPSFPVQWPQACPDDPASLEFSSVTAVRSFSLRTPRENFGNFFVAMIQPDKFNPYLVHLENTLSLVSLILETKQQNVQLKESSADLESKVAERTETLKERDRHIRLLLDSAAEAIYGLDEHGHCTFCNRSCIEMLGYASETDLLGKNMHELIHHTRHDGTNYPVNECSIYESFRSGENIHSDNEILWKADGSSFAAEYWSHPILDDGKAVGAVVTFLDISQRKEAERELQRNREMLEESEEHYRVLFRQAPHGSAVADAETGIILECNQQLAKLVGRPVEELIGKPQSILHPQCPESGRTTKTFDKHRGEMEGQIFEDQLIDKEGNIIDVEINATRMTLNGRDVLNGFFYDISERKKMFEEYRRSAQLAALGTVAAGVAHEINNPIQGIMNYATIIEKTPGQSDRTVDIARRISGESDRIAEITRELLDFAKDNHNRNEYCDFRDVVESAIDLIEKKTIRRGISIETIYDDNLPKTLIYRQGIQQIVINLIDNSCDALEYQDIPLDEKVIKVICYLVDREEGQNICMEIADQGMGMSEETLQRATETFYSTKPSTKGTGLGLSIVNDIVNKHNGTMSIESSEGEYTKVKICLPVVNHQEAR